MHSLESPDRLSVITFLNGAMLIACLALGAPEARCQNNLPAGHPAVGAPATAQAAQIAGKVSETMNAAGYTYVQVDTGSKKVWVAAPQFSVKVGDTVAVGDSMPMPNYHSKTLNRDFDLVYFAGSVTVNGKAPGTGQTTGELPKNHPPVGGTAAKPAVDFSGIKKAKGGHTIAEIFARRADLKGKSVTVRGKVVKYNSEILGKNWLHIQDGTGRAPGNDLTVTTAAKAKVGDTVLVDGKLAADRDFGSGYRYDLIIEDAKVIVE